MRIFPVLTLFAALLIGCDKKDPDPGGPGSEPNPDAEEITATWPATKATKDGNFTVTVNPTKGEILENEHFSLDVSVAPKNANGTAIVVKVDADMPAHQHGMNTAPELVPQGDLKYRADGMLFHMAGEWVIMVDVTRDGKTERASFPVQVE